MKRQYFLTLLLPIALLVSACGSSDTTTTATPVAPVAPAAPTLTASSVDTEVVLSWAVVAGAVRYEVYRDADDNVEGADKLADDVSALTYTDATAMADTNYFYWLKACSASTCSADFSPSASTLVSYTVKMINLTAGQIFSPPLVILHGAGYSVFTDGEAASVPLEQIAEGGNPVFLDMAARADVGNYQDSAMGSLAGDPTMLGIMAGGELELTVETRLSPVSHLSLASMLVRTNDGFTALNAELVSNLDVEQTRVFHTPAWDAGTEANAETTATMPVPLPPPAIGEMGGFNAARDDEIANKVAFHSGVVTARDGLPTSELRDVERFDNPVMRVEVTRTQ